MRCPACDLPLQSPHWSVCSGCRLVWSQSPSADASPLALAPPRRLSLRVPFADIGRWGCLAPLGLLSAASVYFPVMNVVHGTDWRGWLAALVGLSLGLLVGGLWASFGLQVALGVLVPDVVELGPTGARVQVRGEGWWRSDVRFAPGELVSVSVSAGQGEQGWVWAGHRAGPAVLLAIRSRGEAEAVRRRLADFPGDSADLQHF